MGLVSPGGSGFGVVQLDRAGRVLEANAPALAGSSIAIAQEVAAGEIIFTARKRAASLYA